MYVTAEYYKETETSNWRNDSRRRLRPRSNLIYPMRARSNIRYHSPPPPYEMYRSPPPGYSMPGQTLDTQQTDPEAQEEMEIPAEPEPDRNLDMVDCFDLLCKRSLIIKLKKKIIKILKPPDFQRVFFSRIRIQKREINHIKYTIVWFPFFMKNIIRLIINTFS